MKSECTSKWRCKMDKDKDIYNKRELYNKRHRETYACRRKKEICVRCGDKNKKLEILQSGREGIMCSKCGERKRELDTQRYYRERDK